MTTIDPNSAQAALFEKLGITKQSDAQKAKSDGCDVELEIWNDMIHIFQGFAPFLPEANRALKKIGSFISDK